VKKLPLPLPEQSLTSVAQAVLQTAEAQEPDELLFTSLPQACGLSPIVGEADDGTTATTFRTKLVAALQEIRLRMTAY